MTVCVAARCSAGAVFGIADRMITSGDIQFEPTHTHKAIAVTTSIVAMTAGDATYSVDIMERVRLEVSQHLIDHPAVWMGVRQIAEMYVKHRNEIKLERAEANLLAPLGLNRHSFITNQQMLTPELANRLTTEMINFAMPSVSAILTGVDPTGSHIYVVRDQNISCHDSVGFAAIGSGARHAESQFMFERHSYQSSLSDTLLRTYSAKRRAEVAPGVGRSVDMFTIGPPLGSFTAIRQDVIDRLDVAFETLKAGEERSQDAAKTEIQHFVDELMAPTPVQQPEQQSEQPAAANTATPDATAPAVAPDREAGSEPTGQPSSEIRH